MLRLGTLSTTRQPHCRVGDRHPGLHGRVCRRKVSPRRRTPTQKEGRHVGPGDPRRPGGRRGPVRRGKPAAGRGGHRGPEAQGSPRSPRTTPRARSQGSPRSPRTTPRARSSRKPPLAEDDTEGQKLKRKPPLSEEDDTEGQTQASSPSLVSPRTTPRASQAQAPSSPRTTPRARSREVEHWRSRRAASGRPFRLPRSGRARRRGSRPRVGSPRPRPGWGIAADPRSRSAGSRRPGSGRARVGRRDDGRGPRALSSRPISPK